MLELPRELLGYETYDRWDELRKLMRTLVERSLPDIRRAIRDPDPITSAALGKKISAASNIERSFVTRLGNHARDIVALFLVDCDDLGKGFWHLKCYRRRVGDNTPVPFVIKVVKSADGLNSTQVARIEKESEKLPNPVVLSLEKSFHSGEHYRKLGKAYWLDAPATWYWLTGDPRGYQKFLDILHEEFRDIRREIAREFEYEYNEYRRRKILRRDQLV